MRCNRVSQAAGLINTGQRCQYFVGYLLADIHIFFEVIYGFANCRISIGIIQVLTLDLPDSCHRKRFARIDSLDSRTLTTFYQHLYRAIRQFE